MAARPSWQGHLKLSLVTCPVALYNGVSASGDVHFNLLNPKTMNRIKMVTTDPDTGPIERSELVKGYQVEKGQYIILTDEEIKSVRLESTKSINIERFVDADEIDRLYWHDPYYLVPNGDLGVEARPYRLSRPQAAARRHGGDGPSGAPTGKRRDLSRPLPPAHP